MADWHTIVRKRLGSVGLDPIQEAEVAAELAAHFEDLEDDAQHRGFSTKQAAILQGKEVPDWSALRRKIRSAKCREVDMKERIRCLWIPGLTISVLALGLLTMGFSRALRALFGTIGPSTPLYLTLAWMLMLPLFGALGAYWSRRTGGSRRMRLLAATFPVYPHLAILTTVAVASITVDFRVPLALKLLAFVKYLLVWVLVPGAALLLGALPFLREPRGTSTRAVA